MGGGSSSGSSGAGSSLGGWLGGSVTLIDFSNAMGVGETHAYHDQFDVSTLAYRAPELLYGLPFDTPIDIWSLGVTLAELYAHPAPDDFHPAHTSRT